MPISHFRFLVPALAGLVLLLMMLADNAAPVSADGSAQSVHFFGTVQKYQELGITDTVSKMKYHGGSIMLSVKTYLIFWGPAGHNIPDGYRMLIKRYFKDIGGSSFFNILTQYYKNPGQQHPSNISTYGGAWVDTANNYPHAGSAAHPLLGSDIQAEINRAINQKHWANGFRKIFFVFTAKGIESCLDATLSACTPGVQASTTYCAYHRDFFINNKDTIYANMPYAATWGGSQGCKDFQTSPNGNLDADTEISAASHEHFEAANDPQLNAWYDNIDFTNGEIGDKCAYYYGAVAGDGSNLTLNGHKYRIQLEWSNARSNGTKYSGCAKSY